MAKVKLYKSAEWLRMMFVLKKKSIEEMAAEAGCSTNSIRKGLKEQGLIR